jgi:hypothetical protein
MYDGHSDPKQYLMSYEATISSYGGNTAVMAKSFVMAVKNVAQTWYSSLRLGTITSWQKLKDMLITSFQGFQTKPVTAQALFQCTQDHEEYLQAYVRRFLRLRAQVPTVPNEIVIEAMIKRLRPGPSVQYFTRKPPQTLEKLLQKMDEYICRRFEPGGSLDRRVNCRRVPQPRWVGARRSAKGGRSRRETGVQRGNPRPSCLSRAQVGCACSRGLQASTREGASGLTRAPSRPSPRGQPSVRGPWTFLL